VVARILIGRGIGTPEAVERFLTPELERDWHDPLRIPGIQAAAARIAGAVRAGERIVVFGDFDLDGVSSAALVARGDLDILLHLNLNTGDLWMLAAVAVWAIYTVGLAWRPAGVHPMLMLAAFTAVGLTALFPAYLWEIAQGRTINVHAGSLLSLAYVGIFPSFVGYIFYNRGVAEVGANKASLFIHLMPVFGTLLSVVFLGEIPYAYHYAGIALIFAGIWLTMKKG